MKLEKQVKQAWDEGMRFWNRPSIPQPIVVTDEAGLQEHKVGKKNLAFMHFPSYQVFLNLLEMEEQFENPEIALHAICKHEIGHRFNPYDKITLLILNRNAERGLHSAGNENAKELATDIVNLYTDTCINTRNIRQGDTDTAWTYRDLNRNPKMKSSPSWHVYMRSNELLWKQGLLTEDTIVTKTEQEAAASVARLFHNKNPMDKNNWEQDVIAYARILSPFLTEKNDGEMMPTFDDTAGGNKPTPEELGEIGRSLARRLAKLGNDGLPTDKDAVKEYKDLMSGLGEGDPHKATVQFYEQLAKSYSVKFAKKPFGSAKKTPLHLNRWSPSDPIGKLDVQQSIQSSGVLIPGLTTKKWTYKTSQDRGVEEVIPTLDIFIDSSGSMPDPSEEISLPVLAGFVATRRAINNGVRVINYSENSIATERTNNLQTAYENLVLFQGGTTYVPIDEFLANPEDDPRLSLIITDTFFFNTVQAIDAIKQLKERNRHNRVTIYAITELPNAEALAAGGAECIHGTTTNIFKHILGKTEGVYLQ
ncbi:VWA domain-containing protein [Candidatus Woesearchaeota archaeon]|nr:VWA domain-containing protein [Candidatus Woesearchaeota archaeon]